MGNKRWYHDCFQVLYSFLYLFFGWLPEIKKVNYKRYDKPKGNLRKLTQRGFCYYLFYSHWSPKGFRIPFTLKITERFDSSQPLDVKQKGGNGVPPTLKSVGIPPKIL